MGCITLTTDFGTLDHYVGVMKGVIHSMAPDVKLIDITHDLKPQDIIAGAFVLRQVWNWYPADTVHVVVVDPGVGSHRRILAGRYDGRMLVAPDNGLISMVHREFPLEDLRVVENARLFLPTVSSTFHGRDIIAPVAAHLAMGRPLRELGPTTTHLEVFPVEQCMIDDRSVVRGTVLCVDRFGNLVTNIRRNDLVTAARKRPGAEVYVSGKCVGPLRTCYADVATGEPVALIGSSEFLEVSVNCGRADKVLGCSPTAEVTVE
ncbi:MAG: SAM-dependent chlorinase/fluorinase [bacterium]|nr:SAM-dependent chlorinase/fluorinase [bacterium]